MNQEIPPTLEDKRIDSNKVLANVEEGVDNAPEGANDAPEGAPGVKMKILMMLWIDNLLNVPKMLLNHPKLLLLNRKLKRSLIW